MIMARFERLLGDQASALEQSLTLDEDLFESPQVGGNEADLKLVRELARAKNLLKATNPQKPAIYTLLANLGNVIDNSELRAADLRDFEAEANRHLSTIHRALHAIAKTELGKTDVFANHLLSELEKLSEVTVEAANKGLLHVKEHQFVNAKFLLDAFGSSERVIRYTWRVDPSERLFADPDWRRHFELTSSLAISRCIKAIRVILIIRHRNDLDAQNVQKLLGFFASQEGLAAKTIVATEYEGCAADHAIPDNCLEFGIYADRLLYQAHTYSPVSVGSWSKDLVELQRFTRFYDYIWNSQTIAANNPAAPAAKITLSQLMAADVQSSPSKEGADSRISPPSI